MSGPGCPRCRRSLEAGRDSCPGCERDVSALRQISGLADRHFNRGLRAAQARDWQGAAEELAVTLALRPDDLEATVLAARVARHQGRAKRSQELADRVAILDPARPVTAADPARPVTAADPAADPVPPSQVGVTGLATGLWWLGRAARRRWEGRRG